jgi:hypothetical protein
MMGPYPSGSWALQWLDLLREEGVYLSRGMLRNALHMCSNRQDVYGLLEVLYAAQREDMRHSSHSSHSSYSSRHDDEDLGGRRGRNSGSGGRHGVGEYQYGALGGDGDSDGSDGGAAEDYTTLRQRDWNKACVSAWHSRVADMPSESFKEAFTEVMRLMRESGVELETSTTRTLLRFLVHTQPKSEITWKIVRRLYRDKSFPVCHIELVALSALLLRRLSSQRNNNAFALATPLYRSENYLFVYPGALTHIVDQVSRQLESLSEDFVHAFELAWRDVHSAGGRRRLYDLMLRTVSAKGQRGELIRSTSEETRQVISLVCAYSAYLVGAQDSEHRQAYDLLYAVESLNREADEHQLAVQQREEEEEREGGDADGTGMDATGRRTKGQADDMQDPVDNYHRDETDDEDRGNGRRKY